MLKFLSFLFCVFAGYSAANYVETLDKCSIKDNECIKNLYRKVVKHIGTDGLSEYGIPPVDPIALKNITVSLFGVIDIILVEGTAKRVSDCELDVFTLDLEKGSGYQENTCNIILEGQHKVTPNVLVNTILGENALHADGKFKIELNKLHIKFDFPMHVQKRDDGETYLIADYKNVQYEYDIRGNTVFAADNIYLGEVETSATFIPFLNQNEKFIMKTLGKPFVDKAVELFLGIVGKFLDVVPTKHYISDDLSSIAKE